MPMKLTKAQRHPAASLPPAYALLPGPYVPHHLAKVPAHIARRPDIQLFGGITLIQPRLPSLLGQFGLTELRDNARRPPPMSPSDAAADNFAEAASDNPDMMPIDHTPPPPDPNPGQHRRKRAAQWQRWQQEVIPALLPHFARLLQEMKSLRDLDASCPTRSPCDCSTKLHKVAIVRFSTIEDLELQVCKCTPAAVQLMQVGVFGCAPILLRPEQYAISIALERVLANMGFQLDHQVNTIYGVSELPDVVHHLRNRLKAKYTGVLEAVREVLVPQAEQEPEEITTAAWASGRAVWTACSVSSGTPTPPSPKNTALLLLHLSDSNTEPLVGGGLPPQACAPSPSPDPLPGRRKRNREPSSEPQRVPPAAMSACFGNLQHDASEIVDVMVSIDTCFMQKKKKSPKDPPKYHPDTHLFRGPGHENGGLLDSVRNTSDKNETRRKRQARDVEEEEDGYNHKDLLLPRSVLDGCEASFKAADEKREKASTEFFEDTRLMALLCRHDRVLWIVNMHSAGEKQFGVILLIERLFEHLPRKVHVGILYDIGCLLERSCLKWGFLSRWIDRIVFAVGFGLSDGEGCERFWNSIHHLILHLWISGYHNCLYTLDAQIEHTDETSLLRLEATKALREGGKSQTLLREQWKLQVLAQTKPLPRRTKNRGEKAVNGVILLRSAMTACQGLVHDLRQKFLDAVMEEDPDAAMYETEFKAAEEALRKLKELLRQKEAALGVDEQQDLQELASSEYMHICMNARTLKIRLRLHLHARKFELDPVERALRRLVNDSKLHAHTAAAVKRREPTITKLVGEYNKLCAQIAKLIKDGKAPRGSTPPVPIPAKGLWQFDVDDAIFQDVGLDDNDDGSTEPPLWLCDEQVRAGIKAVLQLDRCDEEDAQLLREKCALRVWFAEEWDIVSKAIEDAESEVDKYHLRLHQDKLVRLCATWEKHLPDFSVSTIVLLPWGPSAFQMVQCNVDAHLAARGEDRHYERTT
ncbi:hypothetical protein B0H13DRAFT_2336707 [Mycena leptocephala]|nr:hypothetical protein B0H13DRAFT_2336707 [Mycena leptocephala]